MFTEEAWAALKPKLAQYIQKRVSNRQDAEDLLHDVCVRALETRTEDIINPAAWLYRVAHNRIVDYHRGASRSQATDYIEEPVPQLDQENSNHETARCLLVLAEHLAPTEREAILEADYRGRKQAMLSSSWGLSVSGGKSRIQRARRKLRQVLLECCEVTTDREGNVLDLHPKDEARNPCSFKW